MKIRFLLGLTLLAAAGAQPVQALDFTLHHGNVATEGASLSSSYITDGDSKIMLRIPNTWKASDNPSTLDLIPDKPASRVSLSQIRGAQALPLDVGGKANLLKQAVAQLPSGAKNVVALPEEDNLLPINHWTSVEFTHRYEFYGQTMRRSVVFVNMLPGRIVQMSVTAPDALFDGVHEEARVLLNHWFEPRLELTPEQAKEYENPGPGLPRLP